MSRKGRLTVEEYVDGVLSGNRVVLSKAITLVESNLATDIDLAGKVMEQVLPHSGNSIRIGITGVPGVGKSTFIESFGKHVIANNKKIAVLAIDPSSQKTRGSILGDKTRMESLSTNKNAYIRPTPAGDTLGGVANNTRETMLLCEAAGFDVIVIETVGVGQSETKVKGMTDFFLLLMLAGAGDELQGIKKGIMEMADAVVINKADGDNLQLAKNAMVEYENALHLFPASYPFWYTKVMQCSSLNDQGINEVWEVVSDFTDRSKNANFFEENRRKQNLDWFYSNLEDSLKNRLYENQGVTEAIKTYREQLEDGKVSPSVITTQILNRFFDQPD